MTFKKILPSPHSYDHNLSLIVVDIGQPIVDICQQQTKPNYIELSLNKVNIRCKLLQKII